VVRIRPYEDQDAGAVGIVIANTFREFNLDYASPSEQSLLLGPFRHVRSLDPEHQSAVARTIEAPTVIVAESDGRIVGVLRGSVGRLHSLFVSKIEHGRGIGRRLVAHFEQRCQEEGATQITLAASLYAVGFHRHLGHKRSTGVRHGPCFDGVDYPSQPMKKRL